MMVSGPYERILFQKHRRSWSLRCLSWASPSSPKLICARLTRLQPLTRNSFWRKLPPGPQEFQLRLKCQITALEWGWQAALLSSDVVLPRTLHLRDIIYVSQMKMLLFSKSWKISTRKGIEGIRTRVLLVGTRNRHAPMTNRPNAVARLRPHVNVCFAFSYQRIPNY